MQGGDTIFTGESKYRFPVSYLGLHLRRLVGRERNPSPHLQKRKGAQLDHPIHCPRKEFVAIIDEIWLNENRAP
ncbi:hypothetical protein Pelo_10507 [Pelomyxa schiedti]|nr:hypothetical protein Pelo_10507 [Pelomyxa schiedti]